MDINLFRTEVELNQLEDKEFVKSLHGKVFQSLLLLFVFLELVC